MVVLLLQLPRLISCIVILVSTILLQMFPGKSSAFVNYNSLPSFLFTMRPIKPLLFSSCSYSKKRSYNSIMSLHNSLSSSTTTTITTNMPFFKPITFTYQLGTSLYIPLTSKCNSKTLPQTRGSIKFLKTLPKNVLTSLVMVRLAEYDHEHKQGEHSIICTKQNKHRLLHEQNNLLNKFIMLNIDTFENNNDNVNNNDGDDGKEVHDMIDRLRRVKNDIESIISSWLDSHSCEHKNKNDHIDYYYKDKEMILEIQQIIHSFMVNIETTNEDNNENVQNSIYLKKEYYPSIDVLFREIQFLLFQNNQQQNQSQSQQQQPITSIVFAGEGEPTLRLNEVLSLTKLIKLTNKDLKIRVLTNGLLFYTTSYYQQFITTYKDTKSFSSCSSSDGKVNNKIELLHLLKDAGVDSLTVAFPTSCSEQYDQLMDPKQRIGMLVNGCHNNFVNDFDMTSAHESVCQFIKYSVKVGMDVEVTGVLQDSVNQHQTEVMALSLGVTQPFRWRSFAT